MPYKCKDLIAAIRTQHSDGVGYALQWPDLALVLPEHPVLDGRNEGPFHAARLRKLLDSTVIATLPARLSDCPHCGAAVNADCRWDQSPQSS